MLLNFADGRSFAGGACPYFDRHPADRSRLPRIVIYVGIGRSQVEAIVDTGGAYFVCAPSSVALLAFNRSESIGTDRLLIRGIRYEGDLYRMSIQFVAAKGQSLDLNVTVFVPRLQAGEQWHFPSFLGLQGCLEFLRFAVDPTTNTFYFGPLA